MSTIPDSGQGAPGTSVPRRSPRLVFGVSLTVLLLVGGLFAFNVAGAQDAFDERAHGMGVPWLAIDRDSDSDGLPDWLERRGWESPIDGRVVTDPTARDTDDDGLPDGVEAGDPLRSEPERKGEAGISDPTASDTDGDGLGDGDEFFSDTDPRRDDSDDDGLADRAEIEFGSDPLSANPDGDAYPDDKEYERKSNPLAYDLTKAQAVGAFAAGLAAGDWSWAARHLGRLNREQMQSPEYLAGQLAGGFLPLADARDMVANLARLRLNEALLSAIGTVPGAGDAVRSGAVLTSFAKNGKRAESTVASLIESMPASLETKVSLRRKTLGSARGLPPDLRGGENEYVVYVGHDYVGITKNFAIRASQHRRAGRTFTPVQMPRAENLTLGQAKAIEQACIVRRGLKSAGGELQNTINSISPARSYYDDAVAWGERFMEKARASC